MYDEWKVLSCGCCNGLEWNTEYPTECSRCKGSGNLWLSPSGKRVALYPGGPFAGVADDSDRAAAITQEESWNRYLERARTYMTPEAFEELMAEISER